MSSQRYGVIICSRCSVPRIADLFVKTTKCPSCGRSLTIKKMRLYGKAETPQELIPVVGELNKKRGNIHQIVWDWKGSKDTEVQGHGASMKNEDDNREISFAGIRGNRIVIDDNRETMDGNKEPMDGIRERMDDHEEPMDESREPIDGIRERMGDHEEPTDDRVQDRNNSKKPRNRMDRIRDELDSREEFTIQDFERAVAAVGWKREKAVELLRGLMDSGEVYSPRRGSFRFVP